VDAAEQAADGLYVLISATTHLESYSWLSSFTAAQQDAQKAALQAPLETLLGDAEAVLAKHPHYIQRPVSVPEAELA